MQSNWVQNVNLIAQTVIPNILLGNKQNKICDAIREKGPMIREKGPTIQKNQCSDYA